MLVSPRCAEDSKESKESALASAGAVVVPLTGISRLTNFGGDHGILSVWLKDLRTNVFSFRYIRACALRLCTLFLCNDCFSLFLR